MAPRPCAHCLQAAHQAAEEEAATQEHAEELKARIAARQDWIDKEQVQGRGLMRVLAVSQLGNISSPAACWSLAELVLQGSRWACRRGTGD